jgi:general secretion pathway protein C
VLPLARRSLKAGAHVAFDALLKKYFTLVVLGLLSIAAYFQASGAMQLAAGAIGGSTEAAPMTRPIVGGAAFGGVARRSGDPILSRNPFDSVTGPLNAKPVPEMETPRVDLSDPLSVPRCEGVNVMIVTESSDPSWSLAALQGPGEPRPVLRRTGDQVAGKEVAFIGFNPREASPAVWLSGPGDLCQALLFAPPVAVAAAPTPAPAGEPAPPPTGGGGSTLPADIKDKIQKVSDTEFNIDRGVVDKILENQAELMRTARIVPESREGKVVGIRLFGIRSDSLLGTLGMQNGDRLESINGFDMSSPEKALEAYARLRTAGNLNVKVNRRGQPVSIDYRIK